ncbi:MAG TPA: transglycosylase domain-containing protein [Candidatus Saccharimonadales bacterium]|nr:transglycosylase domain-containing protein [Candidatus Saccharimonadales bacterium]
MSDPTPRPRRKAAKNTYTTKSGKTITLNQTLGDRMRARKEAKAQRKAAYLSTLPKEPWKRWLYRFHPKRVLRYWFSRDGAIMALKLAGIGFVVVFLVIVGLFAYFRKDLPKLRDINSADSGGSIAYYDRTNTVLLFQDYDLFKRIPIQGTQMSKYLKEATITAEDRDFYHEGAFNVKGITRAAINNAQGKSVQGGSTITQQLVKLNEGWTSDRTVSRKVKELILAVEVEREYSKDDILTAYLNLAPYSGLDAGAQAAAQDLFHVDASQLTLAQSALLASIPQNPSRLSPYASMQFNPGVTDDLFDQQRLIGRQRYILDQMVKQGYITQAEADAAKGVDILAQVQQVPATHYAGIKYPYFVLAAREELQKDFPASVIKSGGWHVQTTIDINLQNLAEKSLNDNLNLLHRYHADNAAFVAEDNATGEVVALIGGVDFNNDYGKINYATDVNISPGSSIKPYDYTNFINNNNNVGAGSVLYDKTGPLPVNGYQCTDASKPSTDPNKPNGSNCLYDYDRGGRGPITLRYALGASLNIPAVKSVISSVPGDTSANRTTSVNKMISTVDALMGNPDGYRCYNPGVEDFFSVTKDDETQCYAASAIGDGAYLHLNDHVNGIASLARLGKVIPQTFILKVTNNSNKVIPLPPKAKPVQVVKTDSAYIVNNMASDPNASYLSGSCSATDCRGQKFHRYKGWTNAIKTGTTNFSFDGLMMSWNPKYTAGVWIGNHTRTIPFNVSPETITDPIMKAFMQGAIDQLGSVKPETWQQPSTIKTAPAFVYTNKYLSQVVPSPSTDIFPGWYVGGKSGNSAATDKVSGKLATSCTPTLARQEAGGSGDTSAWNVDIFMGGNPSTSSGNSSSGSQPSDDVHSCSDQAPTATITAINGTSTSGSKTPNCPATGCTIMVHVEQGTHPFNDSQYASFPGMLTLTVNGQTVQTEPIDSSGDYQLTYTPAADATGTVQLQAQITDSVLYSGTDTQTINVNSSSAFRRRDIATSGPGNDKVALATLKLGKH